MQAPAPRYGVRLQVTARASEAYAPCRAASLRGTAPLHDATDIHTSQAPALHAVGSYDQVAAQLRAYVAVGVTSFTLFSPPHLEEAFRVGENILPLVH